MPNPRGEARLDDCHQHPDRLTLLDEKQQAWLWHGRKVADGISQCLEHPINRQRDWEYLKAMAYPLRVPHPHNSDTDAQHPVAWEKVASGV